MKNYRIYDIADRFTWWTQAHGTINAEHSHFRLEIRFQFAAQFVCRSSMDIFGSSRRTKRERKRQNDWKFFFFFSGKCLCECVRSCNMEIYWLLSGAGDLGAGFILWTSIEPPALAGLVKHDTNDAIPNLEQFAFSPNRFRLSIDFREIHFGPWSCLRSAIGASNLWDMTLEGWNILSLAWGEIMPLPRNWFTANIKRLHSQFPYIFKLDVERKTRSESVEWKMCASDK